MPITQEEADAEVKSINEEIAREKGINPPEKKADDTPKEEEPAEEKPTEDPKKPEEGKKPEDGDEDDDEGDDSDDDEDEDDKGPKKRHVSLRKYTKLTEKLNDKDATIAKLTADLNKATTTSGAKEKVRAFAEKHGWSEEQVVEFLDLTKSESALDPDVLETIKESKQLVEKAKAEKAFNSEVAELISEFPEAKDVVDLLKKEAFKKENLERSLYEVFVRFVKPTLAPPPHKGAESTRANRTTTASKDFDPAKIAERVKAGENGLLNGLTGDQQDKVFEFMEKSGSRYSI